MSNRSDPNDRASVREAQLLAEAQARHLASRSPEPEQLVVSGVVLCIDCDEPVQPKRLQAKPNAARCIGCQQLAEEIARGS